MGLLSLSLLPWVAWMWVASAPGPLLLFTHFPYQQPAPGSPCFGPPASCLSLNLPFVYGSMPPSELVPTP